MACLLVVGRNDAAGFPLDGPNDIVVSNSLVLLRYQSQVQEGTLLTKRSGCDVVCARRQAPDRVEGMNLTLEVCSLDYELEELLTQSGLVIEDNIVVGSTMPDIDAEITQRVSIMAFAELWDGDERATDSNGDPLWRVLVFPSTSWVPGDGGAENAEPTLQFTGRGFSNSNFGTGPIDLLPDGVYITPKGEYQFAGELPEANCGYLLASGS